MESHQRLNSADHFATIEYVGLVSTHISDTRRWISLAAFVPSFMTAMNSIFRLSILPMGIFFQKKVRDKMYVLLVVIILETDKGLLCTKTGEKS